MTRPIPVRLADLTIARLEITGAGVLMGLGGAGLGLALFVPLVMATPVAIIGAALLILGGIFHHKKPAP